MSFWQCLVYHGCRVGGYRDHVHAMMEQGQYPWILKSPDSTAGSAEADCIAEDLKSKHFALPPNKRVNYAKLGIASINVSSMSHMNRSARVLNHEANNRQGMAILKPAAVVISAR